MNFVYVRTVILNHKVSVVNTLHISDSMYLYDINYDYQFAIKDICFKAISKYEYSNSIIKNLLFF